MIKLVATDIDGTILIPEGEFTLGVKDCINKLCASGIKVVLVTGRMNAAAVRIAQDLGLNTPVVSYQGGLVVENGKKLYEKYLTEEQTERILAWAKKEDIHICLETSGYAPTEKFLEIKDYIDLFLYDYKITNEKEHIKYTGVSNELILHNLSVLDKNGALVVLRCPIIPTINDNEEHLLQIGKLADKYDSIKEINLMPYHTLGNSKRLHIGKETVLDNIENVSRVKIREYADRIITKKKIIC